MKLAYVDFRAIKAAVSIRRILEHYGHLDPLKEQGDRLSGRCPLCEGDSSFRVSQSKNCFKCFRCDAGGNILDLVAAVENASIREAALRIAEWFGIGPAAQLRPDTKPQSKATRKLKPERRAGFPPEAESATDSRQPEPGKDGRDEPAPSGTNPPLTFELKLDPEHPWFAETGIDPATVEEFGLGFCSKGLMAGRIVFPLRNSEGQLVGYAGRWPCDEPPDGKQLWKFPKELNMELVTYPAEMLGDADPSMLFLAPDPLRVVEARQAGLDGVAWVPRTHPAAVP